MVAHLGLLLGAAFAFAALASFRSARRWRRGTVEAWAVVVDKKTRLLSSLATWNAVFEFTTPDGDTHRVRSNTSNFDDPEIGDRVRIRYDPSNPREARIDRVSHLYALPMILMFVAVSATGVWAASVLSLGPQLGGADPAPAGPLGAGAHDDFPTPVASLPPASVEPPRPTTYEIGLTSSFPGQGLRALAIDPEGRVAAVAVPGDTVVLLDLGDGTRRGAALPGGRVYSLAFSPDGTRVLAGTSGRVVFVDVPTARVGRSVEFGSSTGGRIEVTDLTVSPSGEVAAATAGADIVFLDIPRRRTLGALRAGNLPLARLAWSADGRLLASLTSGNVAVWPTTDLSELAEDGAHCRLDVPERGTALAFAGTAPHLVVALAPAGGEEASLLVVDVDTCGSRRIRTGAAGIATRIAAGPAGDLVLVPSRTGNVRAVPLMDGTEEAGTRVDHEISGVLASASGHRVVAFSLADGRLTVLERR